MKVQVLDLFRFSYNGKRFHTPLVCVSVSITNVIIFYMGLSSNLYLPVPPLASTPWYRFFTAQLSHADAPHLWSNSIYLLTAGLILETLHGPVAFFTIYWVGGTVGIMAEAAFFDGSARLLGASAGCFATISSYIAHLLMNWKETPFRLLWTLLIFVYIGLEVSFYVTDRQNNIAYTAHLFGFLQGAFVSVPVVYNSRALRWEYIASAICFVLSAGVIMSLTAQLDIKADF